MPTPGTAGLLSGPRDLGQATVRLIGAPWRSDAADRSTRESDWAVSMSSNQDAEFTHREHRLQLGMPRSHFLFLWRHGSQAMSITISSDDKLGPQHGSLEMIPTVDGTAYRENENGGAAEVSFLLMSVTQNS